MAEEGWGVAIRGEVVWDAVQDTAILLGLTFEFGLTIEIGQLIVLGGIGGGLVGVDWLRVLRARGGSGRLFLCCFQGLEPVVGRPLWVPFDPHKLLNQLRIRRVDSDEGA